ncbi:acetamidase/formamidase family protein [Rhodococcus opacus]|uniref:acetamidase/formamidase family protein n=1 Tax=Rhodococcus opacus TaxID=37919 RepID=UPI000A7C6426|nr:acetamidase/formamidase family protein [Rhodococcus opacus]
MTATHIDAFPLVETGDGITTGVRYVPAEPDTVLWGTLPCSTDAAIVSVEPGETIVVDTVSHEGLLPDQGSDPVAFFGRHGVPSDQILTDAREIARIRTPAPGQGPHIVTGPIAVSGARPGDLLAVRVDDLVMRAPYGVISTRHGRGVLRGNPVLSGNYGSFCPVTADPDRGWVASMALRPDEHESVSFPLQPFLGIMGVATDSTSRANSIPPGHHGGNLDIKLLTVGSTLYLPVQVADALLYVGDPHYAQGNGEVALTALEAPLRATLTVDVIPAADLGELTRVTGPFAISDGLLIPTGLHEDLGQALSSCVTNAVQMLVSLFGMDRQQAYLYLSAATDFQVSQAVDLVQGVHGQIRTSDFGHTGWAALQRLILSSRP